MVERRLARAGTVSAEEHERLQRDFAALSDQFEAANEVLSAMGRSAGDPDTVLTTIVESARRLCRSEAAHLYLLEHGVYRLIKAVGLSEESIRFIAEHPIPLDRRTLIGRVGLDRTHAADRRRAGRPGLRRARPPAGRRASGRRWAHRCCSTTRSSAASTVWRNDVSPFDEREMAIVSAFAGQAAMAVNGVKLVQQLEARGAELARKVDELEALREVGEAVSSSLDVDNVLVDDRHARGRAVRAPTAARSWSTTSTTAASWSAASTGPSPHVVDRLRSHPDRPRRDAGRACGPGAHARSRSRTSAPSTSTRTCGSSTTRAGGRWSRSRCCARTRSSARSSCAASGPGDFSEETVDLLETFASQSALALLNAQLYRELKEQSAELELASRHKSEFLASMSHELRTPLNAVLGFSEVLLERMFGDINERQEEYLRDIHGSGEHLLELLNEILDLSKVEAGRMELEYSTFDLRAAAGATPRRCCVSAPALHGIDLRVERRRRRRHGLRRRAAAQAGRAQPGDERGQVHRRRRLGRGARRARRGGDRDHRHRHRDRRSRGGPRAHLRVVPAGRARQPRARRAPASA